MQEARIELLQHMPVFGGIRADVLQFLLGLCPVVSVPANEFFFRENDQADSMFVLEAGIAAVLKSWGGQEYLLRTLKEGDCFGEMAIMDLFPRSASVRAVDCSSASCDRLSAPATRVSMASGMMVRSPVRLIANNSRVAKSRVSSTRIASRSRAAWNAIKTRPTAELSN